MAAVKRRARALESVPQLGIFFGSALVPGKGPRGRRLSKAAQVQLVAELRLGFRPASLAKRYGVTRTCVYGYAHKNGISIIQELPSRITCGVCKDTKSCSEFRRSGDRMLGVKRICKACALIYERSRNGWQPPLTLAQTIEKWSIPEPNTGCVLWTGSLVNDTYGQLSFRGESHRAHRASYQAFKGPIPPGLYVLHHCDTPACVKPEHLFLGTAGDNARDCARKGRNRGPRRRSSHA